MTRRSAGRTSADAVVALSGGQDSALCLALAAKKHGSGRVAAITFSYGQRHAAEIECARALTARFGVVAHKIVEMPFFGDLAGSALLSADAKISRPKGSCCPTTLVEGRNAFFLAAAAVWAKTLGAKTVYAGVSQADYSGYPDCREPFLRAQQRAMRLALDWPVRLVAPFMHMTKAQEWALADELGILDLVRRETLTCYRGVKGDGCGRCPACRLRGRGLREYLAAKARRK